MRAPPECASDPREFRGIRIDISLCGFDPPQPIAHGIRFGSPHFLITQSGQITNTICRKTRFSTSARVKKVVRCQLLVRVYLRNDDDCKPRATTNLSSLPTAFCPLTTAYTTAH